MSALSPPPKDPLERSRDQNIIGRMLLTGLVSLIIAAWVDGCYPEGRDDVRDIMLALAADAVQARGAGNITEANGCDRARDDLSSLGGDD